jgi:hypothetical protein
VHNPSMPRRDYLLLKVCRQPSRRFLAQTNPLIVESQAPDVAFWVVDASDSANWELSVQNMTNSLSSGALQPRDKLIILVNKM